MPTVLRVGGFGVLVLFPPREHPPARVHVVNASGLVVINLATKGKTQTIVRVDGMSKQETRQASRIVAEHTEALMDAWRRIHG